jgi:hypothetical protein
MAFLEWDVFFFGTAQRNGGKSSRRDPREGIDHVEACSEPVDAMRGFAIQDTGSMLLVKANAAIVVEGGRGYGL